MNSENKNNTDFRNYNNTNTKIDNKILENIKKTYYKSRKNQTVKHVMNMHKKYFKFNNKIKLDDVFNYLEKFVDISDPDITLPNYFHGIQTAEAIRKDKHPEWLQLVGLIHDIGKIIYLKGNDEDGTSIKEQWSIVGDTFIVGCALPENIVYPEFNNENSDMKNEIYQTKLGMYKNNCGLDNVLCSFGHDEYLYQVLKNSSCSLPDEALYIIRFHSLYPYHKYGEYKYLTNEKDKKMYKWLKLFNSYDLYTKSDNIEINESIKIYYKNLIKKYIPNSELYF